MVTKLNRYNARRIAAGLTLLEVMAIVMCIALLIGLALPAFQGERYHAIRSACQRNLQTIGRSYHTWGSDFSVRMPHTLLPAPAGLMEFRSESNSFAAFITSSNGLSNPWPLNCPSDDRQGAADFAHFTTKNMSYFIGLDADEAHPAMWLAGERNLTINGTQVGPGLLELRKNDSVGWSDTMHRQMGNFILADGSVELSSSARLSGYMKGTGTNVNRLVVP